MTPCSVWVQCYAAGVMSAVSGWSPASPAADTAECCTPTPAWAQRQYSAIMVHCLKLRSFSFFHKRLFLLAAGPPTTTHFHTLCTNQTQTQLNWSLWHFLAFRFGSSRISKRPEGREGLITGSTKLNTRLNGFHACRNRNRVCCMKCCRLTRSAECLQTYLVVIFKSSRPAVAGPGSRHKAPSGHILK